MVPRKGNLEKGSPKTKFCKYPQAGMLKMTPWKTTLENNLYRYVGGGFFTSGFRGIPLQLAVAQE